MAKKKFLGIILTLSLAFIVSTACFSPVFASVTYYDHASADGKTLIDIQGHQPAIQIVVVHNNYGDHGVGDFLEISTYQYIPQLGRSVWATVAVVTDSPSRADFFKNFVFAGLPGVPVTVLLVKPCELQVFRIGKIVSAIWTVPITSPQLTLPPGCMLFRGYGCAQNGQTVHNLPNGVTLTNDEVGFAAHATLVCPAWKYCGSVGDESTRIGTNIDMWVSHG